MTSTTTTGNGEIILIDFIQLNGKNVRCTSCSGRALQNSAVRLEIVVHLSSDGMQPRVPRPRDTFSAFDIEFTQ